MELINLMDHGMHSTYTGNMQIIDDDDKDPRA